MKNYNIKVNINIKGEYIVPANSKNEAEEKITNLLESLNILNLGNSNINIISFEENEN